MLAAGPVLVYLCFYSFAKRFTRWSHLLLGSAIALSPGAAWVAVHPGSVGWTTLWLVAAVAFWIAGFDVIYACQDIEVDRRDGLHSLPSRIGPVAALVIARLFHVATLVFLLVLGWSAGLGWVYYCGLALTAMLLTFENRMVRPDDFSKVNVAFFTINGLVSILLCAATLIDILSGRAPLL
jgi:4-hydroxybenzoate polyprenyltransferase